MKIRIYLIVENIRFFKNSHWRSLQYTIHSFKTLFHVFWYSVTVPLGLWRTDEISNVLKAIYMYHQRFKPSIIFIVIHPFKILDAAQESCLPLEVRTFCCSIAIWIFDNMFWKRASVRKFLFELKWQGIYIDFIKDLELLQYVQKKYYNNEYISNNIIFYILNFHFLSSFLHHTFYKYKPCFRGSFICFLHAMHFCCPLYVKLAFVGLWYASNKSFFPIYNFVFQNADRGVPNGETFWQKS